MIFVTECHSGNQNRKIRWAKLWRLCAGKKYLQGLVRQPERRRPTVRLRLTFEIYVVLDRSERLATEGTEITLV